MKKRTLQRETHSGSALRDFSLYWCWQRPFFCLPRVWCFFAIRVVADQVSESSARRPAPS